MVEKKKNRTVPFYFYEDLSVVLAQAGKTKDQLINELGRFKPYNHLCLIHRANYAK